MGTWYERLTQKRKEVGLNKAQFARAAGVSSPTVTDWENGVMRPNGDNLLKIARVLKTTPEWLMTGNGDEEKTYPELGITEKERLLLDKWALLLPGQQQEMMSVITEKADYAESIRQQIRAEEASKTKARVVKVGGGVKFLGDEKRHEQIPFTHPDRRK